MKNLRSLGFLITLTALSAVLFAGAPTALATGPRQCDIEQTECNVPDQPPATPVSEPTVVPPPAESSATQTSAARGGQVAAARTGSTQTASVVEVDAEVPVQTTAAADAPEAPVVATPEPTPEATIAPPAEQTPPANQHNLLYGALTSIALTAGGLIVRLLLI